MLAAGRVVLQSYMARSRVAPACTVASGLCLCEPLCLCDGRQPLIGRVNVTLFVVARGESVCIYTFSCAVPCAAGGGVTVTYSSVLVGRDSAQTHERGSGAVGRGRRCVGWRWVWGDS